MLFLLLFLSTFANAQRIVDADAIRNNTSRTGYLYIPTVTPTANRVCVFDGSSVISVSTTTATELSYLGGATSNIQTQLNSKAVYPTQTGNAGKFLQTDGSNVSWQNTPADAVTSVNGQTGVVVLDADDVLPDQTGNAGKVIQTNGSTASWQAVAGTGTVTNVTSTDTSIDITSPTTTPNLSVHFPMSAPGGSAAAPSYRFDVDTGMFSQSDGVLNFSTNATQALVIDNNQQITATNTITATDFIYPSKTAKTFLAAPNAGAGVPTFRTITQGDFTASALPFPMNAPAGSAAAPSYNFTADTGMFSPSSGLVAFSTNGVERMRIENNGPVNMFGDLTITGNFAAANYPPVDDANTVAYFDAAGVLHNLPNWGVDPTFFGTYNNLSASVVDATNTNFSDFTYGAGMAADAPTANVTGATETLNLDNAASTNDIGNVYLRRMELRLNGNGDTAYSANLSMRHLIGNGSTTGTLQNGNGFDNYVNVGTGFSIPGTYNVNSNNATIDGTVGNFYGTNNFYNGPGSVTSGTGASLGFQIPVTNDLQMSTMSNNATVGGNYTGYSLYSDSVITGNSNLFNVNQTQPVGGSLVFFNSFGNGTSIGGDYRGLQFGNNASVAGNGGGNLTNQSGVVSGSYTGTGQYVNESVGTLGNGNNLVYYDSGSQGATGKTVHGNIFGLSFTSSHAAPDTGSGIQGVYINNGGTGYRFHGLQIYNQPGADMDEEIRGATYNLQGDARTGSGLNLTMQGAYLDDVHGLQVDVANVTTSSATNHVMAAEIAGGNIAFYGKMTPFSGVGVDIGNYQSSTTEILNGSPVTGTDIIQQIFQSNLILHDTIAPGPFGLGVNSTAIVPQIQLDSGIVLPYHRTLLLGTSVPAGSGGTITDGVVAEMLGYPSFGGSLSVDNLVGLQDSAALGQQFCDYATNCWFMRAQDTRAETLLPKLAINTPSQKVAAGVRLEVHNGHVRSTQTTDPVATVDANAGTGATCDLSNETDSAGTIILTTGSAGWNAGIQCSIAFNTAYNTPPICVFSPVTEATIAASVILRMYINATATDLLVNFGVAAVNSTEYRWNYYCMETQP